MLTRKAEEESAQHSCLCSNWTLAPEQTQLFPCIAVISMARLVLCEPLPYTAHRVQVLLCKGIIPKHRSMYVTQKKDLSYQLLLGRQRLPALWDCIYKQSSVRQQVIDFITESLQDKITVFIMMWLIWRGKERQIQWKINAWMYRSWSLVLLQGHNCETVQLSAFWSSAWFCYSGTI